MLTPVTKTAPSALVTLSEAKQHLEIDHNDRDNYITGLIAAASKLIDGYDGMVGKAIGSQVVEYKTDAFPIAIPYGPVTEVNSITYYDETDTQVSADVSDFTVRADEDSAVVYADSYPQVRQRPDAITVNYDAGFDSVPDDLKHACLFLVAHWYQNREAVTTVGVPKALEFALDAIIGKYKAKWIAA